MALKDEGFKVILASPTEYAALTAEIFFDGKFVALVNQERGLDQMELELPGVNLGENQVCRKVGLHGFLLSVESACKRLRGEIN